MSDPLKLNLTVPEDCPKAIELMSIWVQATEFYTAELTTDELQAATTWFNAYIDKITERP